MGGASQQMGGASQQMGGASQQMSQQQQQQSQQQQQQPQQQARPMVVWNGIMELTEVVCEFYHDIAGNFEWFKIMKFHAV